MTAFQRKKNRLRPEEYRGRRRYFLTLCCEKRFPAFRSPKAAEQALHILRDCAVATAFHVHAYCFMPEHLHLLVEGANDQSVLSGFVKRFKQISGHRFHRTTGRLLWQAKFYDHILRSEDDLTSVCAYIWLNPVRRGLCRETSDYPFSGSLTMPWKGQPQNAQAWTPPWRATEKMPA